MRTKDKPIGWSDLAADDGDVKELSGTIAAVLSTECDHIQSKVSRTRHVVWVSIYPPNYLHITVSKYNYPRSQLGWLNLPHTHQHYHR